MARQRTMKTNWILLLNLDSALEVMKSQSLDNFKQVNNIVGLVFWEHQSASNVEGRLEKREC